MALYVLFENKNTLLCIYFICNLFNLQMCQIILADPVVAGIGMMMTRGFARCLGIAFWVDQNTVKFRCPFSGH